MGEFVCRVADANGRVYSHVEAAGTQAEARQKLADRGLYVYSVENRSGLISGMLQRSNARQVGGSDFLILNQQFNTLIKAGLPILRALDLLTDRAATPRLRPIISQVRDRVREGKSRSEEGGAVFDRLKFRLPLIGDTSLKFQVAQFCRTLATLLTGGTPLVAGLQTAADAMDSPLLRGSITRATQMVREGDSLNAALAATEIMPALALDMIEVGESSGALAPMLTSVAEFYEEEVNIKLSAMVSLIEPAILIFMGILVAFILISLYLPIFSFSITGATGH